MAELEVPPYFLCPITLEIMADPVTVATGITYDRASIERWVFHCGNANCPVTKLPLSDGPEMTPNIVLRRMIQSWCALHRADGEHVTVPRLMELLDDARNPEKRMECLQRLRSIASEHTDKRVMEAAGVCGFLAALIVGSEDDDDVSEIKARDVNVALAVLCSLQLSESSLKSLVNGGFVDALTRIMQRGCCESRANAVTLLKSMVQISDPEPLIFLKKKPDFFKELARILGDRISEKASAAALRVLIDVCPSGRNRIKAAEAGAVKILIDLLLDTSDKRFSEKILVLLDLLCQCADGRAHLLEHGGGLAVVSRKILTVSHVANERAVRILQSVARFSASPTVLSEMLQVGAVVKLCLILQVNCGPRTKERAREMLLLHARAWRDSSCIPRNLVSLYPTR